MTLHDIRRLFAYNAWATARTFESVAPLTEEEWSRELGNSFPTLRDTVGHIVSAEWIWLRRWQGNSPMQPEAWMKEPTRELLLEKQREVQDDRNAFIATLSEADLAIERSYTFMSGKGGSLPLGTLFQHLVNHGTYHRGQVTTLLRQIGRQPLMSDLLFFAMENPE
ncbi:MAG: DinB family protein [Rhodothermales bacterium]